VPDADKGGEDCTTLSTGISPHRFGRWLKLDEENIAPDYPTAFPFWSG